MMDGHLHLHPGAGAAPPQDPPPRPTAPARKATIRERVDRELRDGMLRGVQRRPTEAWDDLARRATRPAGKFVDRAIEAAGAGEDRDRFEREVVDGVRRAIRLAWELGQRAA